MPRVGRLHFHEVNITPYDVRFRLKKTKRKGDASCEDRTHDLQMSDIDYETDALPTALTRLLTTVAESWSFALSCSKYHRVLRTFSIKKKQKKQKGDISREDRTHALQISHIDYDTDALHTALTRLLTTVAKSWSVALSCSKHHRVLRTFSIKEKKTEKRCLV